MDRLTFIVEMTKALGWPSAVVLIVLSLRRPLVKLIPMLRRVKYGEFEADFDQRLERAEEKAEALRLPTAEEAPTEEELAELPSPKGRALPFSIAMKLAEETPRAAISEAWLLIEHAVVRALRKRNVGTDRLPFWRKLALLQQQGLLTGEAASLLRDLRALRNRAVHPGPEERLPSVAQAREYVNLSHRLVRALDEDGAHSLPEEGTRG